MATLTPPRPTLRSMTGFGRGTARHGDLTYSVEIRAVNHRFLELRLRLPPGFGHLEAAVRQLLSARFRRGRVDLNAVSSQEDDAGRALGVEVNVPLARSLLAAHQRLHAELGLPLDVATTNVAAYPGVLVPIHHAAADADDERALLGAVEQACEGMLVMRVVEGEALTRELARRLDAVESLRARVTARAPEQARQYRLRLEARMRELLGGLDIETDSGRILHEVGMFAEKVDVAEELARLGSHVAQARSWLVDAAAAGEEGIGRRLDFLCQEMHREANTIGSKVQDLEVSEWTIALKAELERLREQVQNVE